MRSGLGRVYRASPFFSGSSGAAFYPTDIAGSQWVYDAALGVTLAGSDVDIWADRSGRGNDLSAASAGVRPVFNVTDADFNGEPSVEGDGVSEWLRDTAVSLSGTLSDITVFTVMKLVTNSNGRIPWTYNNITLSFTETTVGRITSRVVSNTVTCTSDITTAAIVEQHYDGANHYILINGTSQGTPPAQTGTISSGLVLSLFSNASGASASASKYAFDGAWTGLTTGQRDTIRSYLTARFL